jgi:hypothetical protein
MKTPKILAVPVLLALAAPWAAAQQPEVPPDNRQLVKMPPLPAALMREDMLDHLLALNEILALMGENKLAEAGEAAEQRLGRSTMGRMMVKAKGMGPGRFMPPEMHAIGMSMHDAASEFAQLAKSGDRAKAQAALAGITGKCVACHAAFRIR